MALLARTQEYSTLTLSPTWSHLSTRNSQALPAPINSDCTSQSQHSLLSQATFTFSQESDPIFRVPRFQGAHFKLSESFIRALLTRFAVRRLHSPPLPLGEHRTARGTVLHNNRASLMDQVVRRICLQCGRPRFHPWVGKMPWRRAWQPTPVFLPDGSHGQRSLAGYSPWGHKESDTTERLALSLLTGSETTYILCEQLRVGMSVLFRGSTASSGIVQHGKLPWGRLSTQQTDIVKVMHSKSSLFTS